VSGPTHDTDESEREPTEVPALRVALGEYDTGWQEPGLSLARATDVVAGAARLHARLIVLPEMCTTGFTMDAERWAEPVDGPGPEALAALARTHGVWIVAGLALHEEPPPRAVNAAVLFDPTGAVGSIYRKQRLFAYGGEHEHYVAGDAPVTPTVEGVRLGLFVCYDLRFPELFRAVAPDIDAAIVIANWPERRRAHWDVLTRARAIENQCYLVAVNRTGLGGDTTYDGGSVAFDPWGESVGIGMPRVVDIDPARVHRVRSRYPFLRDLELTREAPLRL